MLGPQLGGPTRSLLLVILRMSLTCLRTLGPCVPSWQLGQCCILDRFLLFLFYFWLVLVFIFCIRQPVLCSLGLVRQLSSVLRSGLKGSRSISLWTLDSAVVPGAVLNTWLLQCRQLCLLAGAGCCTHHQV